MINKTIKLLDGAMGSELINRGEDLPKHIWSAYSNLETPDLIYDIHAEYIDAGSRYITTNTFRTTTRAYSKTGLSSEEASKKARKSLIKAVGLAIRAAKDKALVMGSIAPLEDCYEPFLFPGEDIAIKEFREIGSQLKDEGVDIILLETMNNIAELKSCLKAVDDLEVPVWASFAIKNSSQLLSGEHLVDAISVASRYDVDAVLLNCNPLERTIKALEIVSNSWSKEWGIYPNLGIGEPSRDGVIKNLQSDKSFCQSISDALKLGANILGGCCGSNPKHIKLIAEMSRI